MRMKRQNGPGDGCSILRFNTDSSIGGSWVPNAGGKVVEDRFKDFRHRVHNGAMLDQQNPVFSLPLDVLSKFNPANDLFGVVGSQDCGITITFEGDSLERCIKKEDCLRNITPPKNLGPQNKKGAARVDEELVEDDGEPDREEEDEDDYDDEDEE